MGALEYHAYVVLPRDAMIPTMSIEGGIPIPVSGQGGPDITEISRR